MANLARFEEHSVMSSTPTGAVPWVISDVAGVWEALLNQNVTTNRVQGLVTDVSPKQYHNVVRVQVPGFIALYAEPGHPTCELVQWVDLTTQRARVASPIARLGLTAITGVGSTEPPASLVSSPSSAVDAAMSRLEEDISDIISLGITGIFTTDTIELAKRAVQACQDRSEEDLQAWAERLARDVARADD